MADDLFNLVKLVAALLVVGLLAYALSQAFHSGRR